MIGGEQRSYPLSCPECLERLVEATLPEAEQASRVLDLQLGSGIRPGRARRPLRAVCPVQPALGLVEPTQPCQHLTADCKGRGYHRLLLPSVFLGDGDRVLCQTERDRGRPPAERSQAGETRQAADLEPGAADAARQLQRLFQMTSCRRRARTTTARRRRATRVPLRGDRRAPRARSPAGAAKPSPATASPRAQRPGPAGDSPATDWHRPSGRRSAAGGRTAPRRRAAARRPGMPRSRPGDPRRPDRWRTPAPARGRPSRRPPGRRPSGHTRSPPGPPAGD